MLAARLGRNGETCRDGQAERGHLGEAETLAAEQLAATVTPFIEVENELVTHCEHLPPHISMRSCQSASTCCWM